ncbi:MAG: hypothetical protein J4G12_07870 [Gemmatimonadetes bacterium]|nr:hypothetical protein [Gemmatimonadota bacterium]
MRARLVPAAAAVTLALTLGLAGCASGGGGTGGGNANRLTAEDLVDVQSLDAEQAIQRLRPRWARGRGGATPGVIVDGAVRSGGMEALQSIRISEVQEIQYMSASDATLRYGTGFNGGAIVITTKR